MTFYPQAVKTHSGALFKVRNGLRRRGELAVSDFAHSLFVDDKTPLHPVNSSEPFMGSARSFDTCRYTPKHIYRYRMPRIQHFRYGLSEILQLFVSLLHHFAQLLREV